MIAERGAVVQGPVLVDVRDAAERLDISVSKLYQLFRSGRLASLRIDGSRKISLAAIERFVGEQEAAEAAEIRGEVR